jgi:hypothetical protein
MLHRSRPIALHTASSWGCRAPHALKGEPLACADRLQSTHVTSLWAHDASSAAKPLGLAKGLVIFHTVATALSQFLASAHRQPQRTRGASGTKHSTRFRTTHSVEPGPLMRAFCSGVKLGDGTNKSSRAACHVCAPCGLPEKPHRHTLACKALLASRRGERVVHNRACEASSLQKKVKGLSVPPLEAAETVGSCS